MRENDVFWSMESPRCVDFPRSSANQKPAIARAICLLGLSGVPWTLIGIAVGKPKKYVEINIRLKG